MITRIWLFSLAVISLFLITGCVSKGDYDSIVAQRDYFQKQFAAVQEQIARNAQENSSSLKDDLTKTTNDYKNYKSEVTSVSTRLVKEVKALAIFNLVLNNLEQPYIVLAVSEQSGNKVIYRSGVQVSDPQLSAFIISYSLRDFDPAIRDIGNADLIKRWENVKNSGDVSGLRAVVDLLTTLAIEDNNALSRITNEK